MVLRFLGTTASTSNISGALNSIFNQIARIYRINGPSKHLVEAEQLKDFLVDQLTVVSNLGKDRKLVIVLDSIDQLNSKDYALEWFVDELPVNVKLIVSTLPNHGQILANLKKRRKLSAECFVEISELDQSVAKQILVDWLAHEYRSLAPHQWSLVDRMLSQAQIYPLYIKLLFDTLCKWHSYQHPEADQELVKCTTIDKCIEYLFKQVEHDHGRLLVSRAIIYMTAFRNGISESEIEDILSLDDDVLYDIFKFHAPPIRKLPRALWSRLKSDLTAYLVEKEIGKLGFRKLAIARANLATIVSRRHEGPELVPPKVHRRLQRRLPGSH